MKLSYAKLCNVAVKTFWLPLLLFSHGAHAINLDTFSVQSLGAKDFAPLASSDSVLTLFSSDTNIASIHKGKIHLKNIGATTITVIEGKDSLFFPLWIHSPSSPVIDWGVHSVVGKKSHKFLGDSAVAIAANGWHTLVLLATGSVVENWGGDDITHTAPPQQLQHVVAVAAGRLHALALKQNGTVFAWGVNFVGQTSVPQGLSNVLAIAAGNSHSLALRQDGTVVVWGDNSRGQANVPQSLRNVVAIAAGLDHCVALRQDGTVVAWGDNSRGQTNVPSTLQNVVAIAAGWFHTVALRKDGTVVAWGDNSYGQTRVPDSLNNVVSVVAGSYSTFALRNVGTVAAWGDNGFGQTHVPDSIQGNLAAAAGFAHAVAMTGIRQSLNFEPLGDMVYGAPDLDPGATASSGLLVEYTSSDTSVATIVAGKIHARRPGSVLITGTQAGGGSYLAAASVSHTLLITQRVLSLSKLRAWDKAYDGSTFAKVSCDSLGNLVSGDSVSLALGAARFADANVGLAKPVTLEQLSLTGQDSAKYKLGSIPSLSANIVASTSTEQQGNNGQVVASGIATTTGRLGLAVSVPNAFAKIVQGGGTGALTARTQCFGQGGCLEMDAYLPGAAEITISILDNLGASVISCSHVVSASDLAELEKRDDGSWMIPFAWNLRASNGVAVSPGVYLWRIKAITVDGQELETTQKVGIRGQ